MKNYTNKNNLLIEI